MFYKFVRESFISQSGVSTMYLPWDSWPRLPCFIFEGHLIPLQLELLARPVMQAKLYIRVPDA